ncbi:unnamed protein product [Ceutorhynchus assimilis]|uniref:Mitotic spindle assembly checkpoint protein MAD1 n=1 Tax=Ceutorhynchus assimilis TaxID=467358 RepID=A0A9P0DKK7_9CUCU|nr:unnamed protein product [Ceutorhynchus assimilis]
MSNSSKINDTIIKMVNDLKATGGGSSSGKIDDYKSPLKRSMSSISIESFEDQTPVKRFRNTNNLDVSYVGSPREMRRLRADLMEARNNIMCLENRIQHMHNLRKEMQTLFDNETDGLKKQHDYDRKTIEELEIQLQDIRKREAALKLELLEIKQDHEQLKVASAYQINALESEIGALKDESQASKFEDGIESSEMKRKIIELETILQAAQEDAEAQRNLVIELGKELSEKNSIARELELKEVALVKAKNQIRVLENAKEDYMEFQQQAKTQAHKLARYVQLEEENKQLKEDFSRLKGDLKNKLLLEEEVYDLRNRLSKHKELEKKTADLQVQCDRNQMQLAEWKALARGFCETTESDVMLPHLLRSAIERLQQQELTLTSEKVEFESQLKSAQHAAKVSKSELEKNQKLLRELKTTGDQKQNLIHRMQKKLLLVTRERNSYRLQLDSYERDLTMVADTSTMGNSNLIQSQKERIDNLEKVIDDYRDMVAKLENDLQEAQPQLHADVVPVRLEQTARLQSEVAHLQDVNQQLREQKDHLEIKLETLLEGQDSLHGGQVFHLANNPLAEHVNQRVQKLEMLQEENARLKNKLKKMEEGIETSKIGDLSICPKEVQALKEKNLNYEKQHQKLKDLFKSSMQDFRNVIYMLFGYKIDKSNSSSTYKLRSTYAEQQDDLLCFAVNQAGDLDLLATDFSSSLEPLIDLHLKHQNSIPVFLSAVTMDLFNQKTIT